jgi:osmotically inducible protein OsmC
MSAPLYSTTATSTGDGRAGGQVATDDGLLDVTLAIPASMGGRGGATNPEQLFAAGWASCFHSALKMVASKQKIKLVDSTVSADISLSSGEAGELGLAAVLRVNVGGDIDLETAEGLTAAAHQVCPYSVATRGNIPVALETTVA